MAEFVRVDHISMTARGFLMPCRAMSLGLVVLSSLVWMTSHALAHSLSNRNTGTAPDELVSQYVYLDYLDVRREHSDYFEDEEERSEGEPKHLRYCIQVDVQHAKHAHADSSMIICGKAEWADREKWANSRFGYNLLLVGGGVIEDAGLFSNKLIIAEHDGECRPIEKWTVQVQLHQMRGKDLPDAIRRAAQFLEITKKTPDALGSLVEGRPLRFTGRDARFIRDNLGTGLAATRVPGMYHTHRPFETHEHTFERGHGMRRGRGIWESKIRSTNYRTQISAPPWAYGKCPKTPPPPPPKEKRVIGDDGDVCYKHPDNPLCLNYGGALRRQFKGLKEAATILRNRERPKDGNGIDPAILAMIEMLGQIAQAAAHHQFERASLTDVDCCSWLLAFAKKVLQEGDSHFGSAIEKSSAEDLISALDSYLIVTSTLAEYNYGPAFEATWKTAVSGSFRRGFGQLREVAATERSNGIPAGSTAAHIAVLLKRFDALDDEMRDVVASSTTNEYGIKVPYPKKGLSPTRFQDLEQISEDFRRRLETVTAGFLR